MLAKHDPTTEERAVVVRIEPSGGLLAVFPYAPGVTCGHWLMDGYSLLDGSVSVDPGYVRQKTKPANAEERSLVLNFLARHGIKARLLRRIPSISADRRRKALVSR